MNKKKSFQSILFTGFLTLLICGCQEGNVTPIKPKESQEFPQKGEDKVLSTFASLTDISPSGLRAMSREKIGEEDVYITNFSPRGFLLYGEDSLGTISVYGVSGQGELHSEDSVQNPELSAIFKKAILIKKAGDKIITDLEGTPDISIDKDTLSFPFYYSEIVPGESVIGYKPSTLPFNQSEPFESYLPGKKKHDALGCANAAIAMLTSHYRIPDKIITEKGETIINWAAIWNKPNNTTWLTHISEDNSYKHQIAELCCFLYYDVSHLWSTPDYTIITPNAVERFLKDKYFNPIKKSYNTTEMYTYLEKYKRPLLLYGEHSFTKRHYWVVDGYLDYYQDEIIHVIKAPGSKREISEVKKRAYKNRLVHCNWGWGERYNGFYHAGIFIPQDAPPHGNISPFSSLKNKGKGVENYNKNLLIYYTYPSFKQPSLWVHYL